MKLAASDVMKSWTIGEMLQSKITPSGETLVQGRRILDMLWNLEGPEVVSVEAQFDAAEIEGISKVSSGMKWLIHVFAFQLPLNVDIVHGFPCWAVTPS